MTGTLILLRHGESTANADGIFTGWTDVPLTPHGRDQARDAARLLAAADLLPDVVHTSLLRRTITTADIVLGHLDRDWIPVQRSWRLNERHYGALTGHTKTEVRGRTDEATYRAWRRSWATPPPAAQPGTLAPFNDDRYRSLPPDAWPLTESLQDVHARLLPYWADRICTDLAADRTTLVVAHGNSLRALVTDLDQLTTHGVERLNIPTGQPLRYDLNENLRALMAGGVYLDPRAAAREAAAVSRQ
uniref:2,3-bisphosphoglycerate-dependent phosphoglycerate mutase n=1 Tax=Streptomyces sp. F8 TaxID=1436085 RepID=UPI0003D898FB|nr:2,3-bisphosphoglycerate-dependent phosphoglycerate mutase [Streptomyces sp. F8]AHE39757.1 Phosphoglycerate mutase [Streptomyces sp. F8]